MRVQSAKPLSNGGWLHAHDASPVVLPKDRPRAPEINSTKLITEWCGKTSEGQLTGLAVRLGVTVAALSALNCAWATPYNAWAFPMRDGYKNMVGIRLRAENGAKWCVKGSHQGLFYPHQPAQPTVFITEGATDVAAALAIGLFAIGRPSCTGGVHDLMTVVRQLHLRQAIILSDNDSPGLNGAGILAEKLTIPSLVWVPPCKDLREFVKLGGTKELIDAMTRSLIWRRP